MIDFNATTYVLSIEDTPGHSYGHGFHLGTQEPLARVIAQDMFHARVRNDLPVVTVALFFGGRLVDVYDGMWSSDRDYAQWMEDEQRREDAREGFDE